MTEESVVRTFETGANRDVDTDKYDYEGFMSPVVVERFGKYMHKNRFLRDGNIRDSDNWQKGIPRPVYMKSAFRHFVEWWKIHRRDTDLTLEDLTYDELNTLEDALCAMIFNASGYLHELLKLEDGMDV